ncbi:hypothetical protein MSIM_32760 [Mycobacterium simiae]|nr:hypothetical protein MSIM_32760 [Mycobacterium simiae]
MSPVALKNCHNTNSSTGDKIRSTVHRRCLRGGPTAGGAATVSVGMLTIVCKTSGGRWVLARARR